MCETLRYLLHINFCSQQLKSVGKEINEVEKCFPHSLIHLNNLQIVIPCLLAVNLRWILGESCGALALGH